MNNPETIQFRRENFARSAGGLILDLSCLTRIEEKLDTLLASERLEREWYTYEQAWAAKGGCALSTFRQNRYLQPKGGRPDAYVGGKAVFSRDTIAEWVLVADADLEEYNDRHMTGCTIPLAKKQSRKSA